MKQITLSHYLRRDTDRYELTEQDIDQLVTLITSGCRQKTKARVRSILTYGIGSIDNYGIFGRVMKSGHQGRTWTYVAGQSYTDEIRTVRDCILGKV